MIAKLYIISARRLVYNLLVPNRKVNMSDNSSCDTDDISDYGNEIPPEIAAAAKEVTLDLLPEKSKRLYVATYNNFKSWRSTKKTTMFVEEIFLAYFKELATKLAPPTLWNRYSMLKTTVKTFDHIDISQYHQLLAYIKKKNAKYLKKKSKTFTAENVSRFCNDAPDEAHLVKKVILIFGILGALRRGELTNITTDDIEDDSTRLLIKIPVTKNNVPRSFAVRGEFYHICKNYMNLRPSEIDKHKRFFIHYIDGKCTRQPIGLNTIGQMPKQIADWLKLPNPHLYTGHSFRRTSATLLVDGGGNLTDLKRHGGWKSSTVAEGYITESMNHKEQIHKKITKSIVLKPTKDVVADNNTPQCDNQVASTSGAEITVDQPKKSVTVPLKRTRFDSEGRDDNNEIHAEDEFYRLTETQRGTCGSPLKKRSQNNDEKREQSFTIESSDKNISFHFSNCNVTINVHNHNHYN